MDEINTEETASEFGSGLDAFQKRKEAFLGGLVAARQELEDTLEQTHKAQSEMAAELSAFKEKKEAFLSEIDAGCKELEKARRDWRRAKERLDTDVDALFKDRDALAAKLTSARERVEEIQELSGDRNLTKMLFPLLRDSSPVVRRAAVEATANLRSPQLVRLLIQRLDDPVVEVRNAALVSIQSIVGRRLVDEVPEDPRARERLVRRLREWWQGVGGTTPRERRDMEEL